MKPRHAVLLVLTSALALGCASANAQDDQGNPQPPQEQPGGAARRPAPADFESPEAVRRRKDMEALHEKLRAAEDRLTDARARLDQLVKVEKKAADDVAVREAQAQVERIAAEAEELRRQAASMHPRGRGDGAGPRDGRRREFAGRGPGPDGRMGRPEGGPGGPGRGGPGPSVEQRLEMLERAVQEMHAMFERHHVGQEMRERAEHEMRARALGGPDTRPMQPGGPMGPGAAPPPAPPRPPMARPGTQADVRIQMDAAVAEQMRAEVHAALEAQAQEARKQMEVARQRIEELSRQLADTQAALKKSQEELETLRAKK